MAFFLQFEHNESMIETFTTGPIATNSYVLFDETKAAVIDCGFDSFEKIQKFLKDKELTLTKIILTHSHWDHIADLATFTQEYNLSVLVHDQDRPNVIEPGADGMQTPLPLSPVTNTQSIQDGDQIDVGNLSFRVIHTPGHSPGGICLYLEKENILFSGDTLFAHGIGRLDLPTGEEEKMRTSLQTLSALPKDCQVYPGHGPSDRLGNMPFMQK